MLTERCLIHSVFMALTGWRWPWFKYHNRDIRLVILPVWKINPEYEVHQVYWEVLIKEEGFFFFSFTIPKSLVLWSFFFFFFFPRNTSVYWRVCFGKEKGKMRVCTGSHKVAYAQLFYLKYRKVRNISIDFKWLLPVFYVWTRKALEKNIFCRSLNSQWLVTV